MKPKLLLQYTHAKRRVFYAVFRTDDFKVPQPEWPEETVGFVAADGLSICYSDNGAREDEYYECCCYIRVIGRSLTEVAHGIEKLRETFDVITYQDFQSDCVDNQMRVDLDNFILSVLPTSVAKC